MYECLHVRAKERKGITILDTKNKVIFVLCFICLKHHIATNTKSWKQHRHRIIQINVRELAEELVTQ